MKPVPDSAFRIERNERKTLNINFYGGTEYSQIIDGLVAAGYKIKFYQCLERVVIVLAKRVIGKYVSEIWNENIWL